MNRVTVHIHGEDIDIVTLPQGVEVEVIDFDANDGRGRRLRFFTYDGDVMEEVLEPPNIVEASTLDD